MKLLNAIELLKEPCNGFLSDPRTLTLWWQNYFCTYKHFSYFSLFTCKYIHRYVRFATTFLTTLASNFDPMPKSIFFNAFRSIQKHSNLRLHSLTCVNMRQRERICAKKFLFRSPPCLLGNT
jgi:hypothetical protein